MNPDHIQIRRDICKKCKTPCPERATGTVPVGNPCASCPIKRWGHIHGVEDCSEVAPTFERPTCPEVPAQLPGILTMAGNLAKATSAEAAAVMRGVEAIPEEEAQRRFGICRTNACGQFHAKSERCAACGCYLSVKTAWRSQSCPVGKW